jgi:hypothetical protein
MSSVSDEPFTNEAPTRDLPAAVDVLVILMSMRVVVGRLTSVLKQAPHKYRERDFASSQRVQRVQ